MAGKGGQSFGETLGNLLIPQTMAAMQNYSQRDTAERQSDAGNWAARLLMGPESTPSAQPNFQALPKLPDGSPDLMGIQAPKPAQAAPLMSQGNRQSFLNDVIPPKTQLETLIAAQIPKFEKLDAGQTGGLMSTAGGFKPLYTAPVKPPEGMTAAGAPLPGYIDFLKQKADAERDPQRADLIRAQIAEAEANTRKSNATTDNMGNSSFPDEVITGMAQQYLAGDKSIFNNLGRGQQGSQNIARLRTEIEKQSKLSGMSPADRAASIAQFSADTAGLKTAATAGAKMDTLATEVGKFADLAKQASAKVPRSSFVPLTKAEQMVESGTSDPDLANFVAANTSLVNAYAAVAGRGTPTVSGTEHAYKMLSTAMGPEAYNAVVEQLLKETEAAKQSPNQTIADIRSRISAGSGITAPAGPRNAPAPAPPQGMPQDAKRAPDGNWYTPDPARPGKFLKW